MNIWQVEYGTDVQGLGVVTIVQHGVPVISVGYRNVLVYVIHLYVRHAHILHQALSVYSTVYLVECNLTKGRKDVFVQDVTKINATCIVNF